MDQNHSNQLYWFKYHVHSW